MTVNVLVFAGSTRKQSYNKKFARIAARSVEEKGGKATYIDLNDFPLPMFCEDLEAEQGLPEAAKQLKALVASHDALIIANPEYNASVSGLLKNTLDWMSRANGSEGGMVPFKNKTCLALGSSTGPFGGSRALGHFRDIITRFGVLLLPTFMTVSNAQNAFASDSDAFTDPKQQAQLDRLVAELLRVTAAVKL